VERKTKILLLGTYHFDKGGGHLMDFDAGDVTTDKKQGEINEVVQKLMEFKPNKIAVEAKRENEKEINNLYLQFCTNNSIKSDEIIGHRNEIVQIAFRLAHKLNHKKIYPVDVPVGLPEDVFEYGEKNCPNLHKKFFNRVNEYGSSENEFMQNHTVGEILRHMNTDARFEAEHSDLYLYLNQIGAGDTYYGVNTLTEWYRRNLYIFANLQNITKPEDRVLVLYGAGHCKILRNLIEDYNEFEFVDPLDYL
jgi:hypothetical protein